MGFQDGGFNPLRKIQTAESAMPAELSKLNFRTLTPFQRALLVTDGTVTKFIEAYMLDPVEIIRLGQTRYTLEEDHPWLVAEKGMDVMFREVMIRGIYSHTLYVYGVSHIIPDRLPRDIRERLEVQGESIGRVLNDYEMETRREVLWFGRERLTQLPRQLSSVTNGEFISRTYRIIAEGKPIVLITERFPELTDVLPHHH